MAEVNPAVLSSWKEIAAYLGKGVRTVQRWERELHLPIHRPVEHNARIVIAVPEELDNWIQQQMPRFRAARQGDRHAEFAKLRALMAKMIETTRELQERTKTLLGSTVLQQNARRTMTAKPDEQRNRD